MGKLVFNTPGVTDLHQEGNDEAQEKEKGIVVTPLRLQETSCTVREAIS